jgi:hypothetical protein
LTFLSDTVLAADLTQHLEPDGLIGWLDELPGNYDVVVTVDALHWSDARRAGQLNEDAARRRPAMPSRMGGRTWWAHFEFTRINIELTILAKRSIFVGVALLHN